MFKYPKISVIIPVYNAEKFLRHCLDSIIYQTHENLEIICIDDGSTDNSPQILQQYASKDFRIIIEKQQNQGASVARNRGIELAKGEYLHFVDADDWLNLSLYTDFASVVRGGILDIFVFNAGFYDECDTVDIMPKYSFSVEVWDNWQDVNSELTFEDCNNPFCSGLAVWNKIYRTDFLRNKKLKFLKYNPFEDFLFCLQAFLYAESIKITPASYYTYNQTNSGSLTKNYTENIFQIFNVINDLEVTIEELHMKNAFKYAFFQYKYEQLTALFDKADWKYKKAFYERMKAAVFDGVLDTLNPAICEKLKNFKLLSAMKSRDWLGYQIYLWLNFGIKLKNLKTHLFKG